MLSHDHEVQSIRFCCSNQLRKSSRTMTTQKRMDMDDAPVIDIFVFINCDALTLELLNRVSQFGKTIAAVGEGDL